jgi:hypothetical protein
MAHTVSLGTLSHWRYRPHCMQVQVESAAVALKMYKQCTLGRNILMEQEGPSCTALVSVAEIPGV